jgi:hypothetical protein
MGETLLSFDNTPGMEGGSGAETSGSKHSERVSRIAKSKEAMEAKNRRHLETLKAKGYLEFPNTPGMNGSLSDRQKKEKAMGGADRGMDERGHRVREIRKLSTGEVVAQGHHTSDKGFVESSLASLVGVDLAGKDLRGMKKNSADISGSDFSGADLRGAELFRITAKKTSFQDADLKGATIIGNLAGADFTGARLAYATIQGSGKVKLPKGWQDIEGFTITGSVEIEET